MPKYRSLHTKILDSFDFNNMPDDFTRVVWMLLILIVDREGRGIDSTAWLRSKLFPLREDVELEVIKDAFDWLADKKMIVRYQVEDRCYFWVPTFKDHQRGLDKEAESLFPSPPDQLPTSSEHTPDQLSTKSRSNTDSNTDSYVDEGESPTPPQSEINIFAEYEREIGVLTPNIADKLKDLELDHPPPWIVAAIRIASANNARSYSYFEAILRRWKVEGYGSDLRKDKKTIPKNGSGKTQEPAGFAGIRDWLEEQGIDVKQT